MTDSSKRVLDERLYISRNRLLELENHARLIRHVERYALLRQFARGVVCDAACGCGYGSHLLSTNPDVKKVIGLDGSDEAIDFARKEYGSEKINFQSTDFNTWESKEKINMLISVETIEHIQDASVMPRFVERNAIDHVILTYPSKKTTHYNPFHVHDFQVQDILNLFNKFTCYKHFNWEYEFDVIFLVKTP